MNRLDEIRDEMAKLAHKEVDDGCALKWEYIEAYKAGFNAAISVLMPEVEKLVTAATILLENAECREDVDCDHCLSTAILANWHNFIGDKTKGEG